MKATYVRENLGTEVVAPSGFYTPLEEHIIEHAGRRLLYVLGSYCIEASCCGTGSWNYLRVEGYITDRDAPRLGDEIAAAGAAAAIPAGATAAAANVLEVDTVEDAGERAAIGRLLLHMHPGVRMEFR